MCKGILWKTIQNMWMLPAQNLINMCWDQNIVRTKIPYILTFRKIHTLHCGKFSMGGVTFAFPWDCSTLPLILSVRGGGFPNSLGWLIVCCTHLIPQTILLHYQPQSMWSPPPSKLSIGKWTFCFVTAHIHNTFVFPIPHGTCLIS